MAIKKFFTGKYLQPALHVVFWGLFIISPYLFRNPNTYQGFSPWQYRLLLNNTLLAAFFYLNTYLLYPFIYKRRGVVLYIASLVVAVAAVLFVSRGMDNWLFPPPQRPMHMAGRFDRPPGMGMRRFHDDEYMKLDSAGKQAFRDSVHKVYAEKYQKLDSAGKIAFRDSVHKQRDAHFADKRFKQMFRPDRGGFDRGWFGWYFTNLIFYIAVIGISISYRIIRDNAKTEKNRKEKENENLKTELSFLRSQVSPHFIFNTLNSMVALARKKSDMLEPSLIELSRLMRYMLYENDDERVQLSREVEYLKSYIALQMLRFGDDVTIVFNPPANLNAYYIEPMLLAPFVENAFKHGVGMVIDPQINIVLQVDAETGWMEFNVMNTVAPPMHSKDKDSGIGLTNVKRRLELLYKDKHELEITQNDQFFVVNLKLKLTN